MNPFTDSEQAHLPTDHTVVGCLLAQNWWLPEEICLAIRHHHKLNTLDGQTIQLSLTSRRLIAIAQTAEYLVQQITGGSRTEEWKKMGSSCLHLLGMDEELLASLFPEAESLLATIE